jgi:outer membrane protein assembly factor BamB
MRTALWIVMAMNVAGLLSADEGWRQFRGPTGEGHTSAKHLPLTWNENRKIVWKTAIHDHGWSSPVVCGNQIWMTAATKDGHKLFAVCVDRETGKIVHDLHVFDVEQPQPIAADNTYATPTPAIEPNRVYVHFGTYGTVCLNCATGSVVWMRRDLNCDHEIGAGPCSSPFLLGDLLIVNVDGRDVQYMIALDTSNGKTVWKATRSFDYATVPVNKRKAFTMPLLVPRGAGRQLVSPGGQAVYAYDPATGEEFWKARHNGFSCVPRPVYGHGLVFFVTDYDRPELWAVRCDGAGDVTDSHVAWKETRGIPSRSSPLVVEDLLFMISHEGVLSCLEAKTGRIVWKNRVEGKYSASPIHADDRIYFFNENAACTVIRPGRKFDQLAVNRLNEQKMMASPAVAGDSIFIRTEEHLYRVDETVP